MEIHADISRSVVNASAGVLVHFMDEKYIEGFFGDMTRQFVVYQMLLYFRFCMNTGRWEARVSMNTGRLEA